MSSPAEVRAQAATLLSRIIVRKQTLDQVLAGTIPDPLLQELLYGTLRYYFSLSATVDQALRKPLRTKDHDIRCLLLVGLYQLHHTRIPPHAALHETVEAAQTLGKPWAKSLVNAVLRNAPQPERSFEHPAWMVKTLQSAYGETAPGLMIANNERAPMALRVNRTRIDPGDYCDLLDSVGLGWRTPSSRSDFTVAWGPETIILERPVSAEQLPGFADGLVAIQDAGAQLAAALLGPALEARTRAAGCAPSVRLLDACAAPGGKLFHVLERHEAVTALALDVSPARLETLAREARRLGHSRAVPRVGDATRLDWWDGTPFDAVLLDAPCSGSGTLRRHPDIKVLRQAGDLRRYTLLQQTMLMSLWRVVGPGGTLVYCTCSVFPAENDDVIDRFLQAQPDAALEPLELPTGQQMRFGWQLLPTDADTDGFYFARLRKVVS